MKRIITITLIILTHHIFNAQTQHFYNENLPIMKLPNSVKFVDVNKDGILSYKEVKTIFDNYRTNQTKNLNNDVVEEVESTVIDLISYMEAIDCSDIKHSNSAKRFIEIYHNNKFSNENLSILIKSDSLISLGRNLPTTKELIEEDFPENIVTDRPDQTESAEITPKGYFQVEIGAQREYDHNKTDNTNTESTLYNTTLWRYGVSKTFELRIITEYQHDKTIYKTNPDYYTVKDTSEISEGFNPIAIGTKINFQKEKGVIPAISLLAHLELPNTGYKDYNPEFIIPRFRFLFAHTLSDRFTFSYNIGADWEDGTSAATGIYTASLGASLFNNLSMFIEAYGFIKEKEKPDHRLDAGFTYLIGNDFQLDLSGGFGLNEISPDYLISAGISFRINAFNKAIRQQKNRIKNSN